MTSSSASPIHPDPYLRDHPEGCTLAVRVQPGAKRTAITGIYTEDQHPALKICLQAPPVDGKANELLIAFLARLLDLPRSRIHLLHGDRDRFKLLLLAGISCAQAQSLIDQQLRPRV